MRRKSLIRKAILGAALLAAAAVALSLVWVGTARRSWAEAPAGIDKVCTIEQAFAILREAWEVPGQPMWWRVHMPTGLAPYDPDLALKAAADENGAVPDEVVYMVAHSLVHRDPVRALKWAPAQVEKVGNPHVRIRLWTILGTTVAESDPALAANFYKLARECVGKEGPEPQLMWGGKEDMDYALLAGLAGRLESGEADEWVAKLREKMKEKAKGEADIDEHLAYRVGFVAKGSAELAEKISLQLSKRHALHSLASVAAEASFYDKDFARGVLRKMESVDANGPGALHYGQAALYVIVACGESDPRGMLAIARGIQDARYKPLALGLVARYLDDRTAAQVLREASDAVLVNHNHVISDLGWLAGQACRVDRDLGAKLFSEARKRLGAEDDLRTEDIAALAYYMRVHDPAGARLMLETALEAGARGPGKDTPHDRARIAYAMAAFDLDRALEIARSIPDSSPTDRSWALRRIGSLCLEPPAERERGDYLHRTRNEMWIYGGPVPR